MQQSVLTTSLTSDDSSLKYNDFHFSMKAIRTARNFSLTITECDYKNISFLGAGSNSFVYTAVRNGEMVVVKMLKKNLKHGEIAEQELNLEMHLLSKITHPNIIAISGAGDCPRSFIEVEHLAGGTLDQLLDGDAFANSQMKKSVRKIGLKACLSIAKQLVSALKYLHEDLHPLATVIHRDLKPQNIGFDADRNLKLFDFGLAACVRKKVFANETYKMTGFTGTLAYMAPEVALRKPYNEKVDVYSFGIILWQMVTGETPFEGMSKAAYMEQVCVDGLRPSIPRDVPKDLATLMQQCWDADPKRRPSCTAILASIDVIIEAFEKRGGLLSFFPRLFSRNSSNKIVPEDSGMSDMTISPYSEYSTDESIIADLSFMKRDSYNNLNNSRNLSPSHNSISPSNYRRTSLVKLSSMKRRKLHHKKSPRS